MEYGESLGVWRKWSVRYLMRMRDCLMLGANLRCLRSYASISCYDHRAHPMQPGCLSTRHLESLNISSPYSLRYAPTIYALALMMSTNAGFKLAPPTKKPSISFSLARSLQFFSLTLPP